MMKSIKVHTYVERGGFGTVHLRRLDLGVVRSWARGGEGFPKPDPRREPTFIVNI